MKLSFSLFIALASSTVDYAYGHGYLSSPRSRVFYAHQEGVEGSVAGVPKREWFHRSILRKAANQVCGTTPTQNYDDYRDSTGRPMPWIPQGVYSEGQEIDIEVHLTQSHWGHIELYACPDGNASTQECLIRNPLTMVKDLTYGGPRDSTYPQRGYVGIPEGGNGTLRFRYRLPRGVKGNQVMLQWRYVTANSCLPPGYKNNSELISRGWVKTGMNIDCAVPLNWTGEGAPEQFFNCAEIAIGDGSPMAPPPSPVQPPSTEGPPPTEPGTPCGNGQIGNGECADSSLCCSKWGWCGKSKEHCGENPTSAPVALPTTPTPPTLSPPPSEHDSRLIAYLGNWQSCPTMNQVAPYTHIVIAFAVSYTWNPTKNQCSTTCDIAEPPICSNSPNPGLVSEWQRSGKKVILSFGGAGMGGSWDGDVNDCWEHCYGKETKVVNRLVEIVNKMGLDGVDLDFEYHITQNAVNFLNRVTTGLRDQLPAGSEITHAPMDADVVPGKMYYENVLKVIGNRLDFLMPQYYNGITRPVMDGIGGTGAGQMSALSHYNNIVNGIFGGDPKKMVFGFCISSCAGNASPQQASQVMTDLAASHPCNGGAFFWVAEHDTGGSWSSVVGGTIQRLGEANCSSGPDTIPSGVYFIKSVHWGTYLRMHPSGDVDMAEHPLGWEEMHIQKRNGKYSIKSNYHCNFYVSVHGAGEGGPVGLQIFLGPWEEFDIEVLDGGRVAFRNLQFNNYLRAKGPGPGSDVDTQTFVGEWEQFTLIPV